MTDHDGFVWHLHRVSLSEVRDNGFIGVQYDAFGEQDSGMPTIELHHQLGFMSRPIDPDFDANNDVKFGANVLVGVDGDEHHAFLWADPRLIPKLPALAPGDSLQYGSAGNFVRCHADGRISLFTTDDGTPNGQTVALQIMPDGLLFSAPWGSLKFDATGFHARHISGAQIDLGAIGGLPSPLDQLGSYFKVTAALIQNESSIIANGDAATPGDAAVKYIPLLSALTALSASLTSLSTDLVAVQATLAATAGIPGAGGVMAAPIAASATTTTAAVTAIGAAVSAITVSEPLLPSTSTSVT